MWGKSTAAFLLGLPLAVALVGIAALLSGDQRFYTLPALVLFFLAWVGVMTLAFAFRSGARAWLWLGGATLLAYGLMYALKASGLVKVAA
ncbi:hypothetical protein [Massilia sp. YIM B04103]|uniref:hypothetical protein n=1 Tax=Massilia sp. YIM B04103 TaxID=2963106 RepID=UPI00210C3C8B|nr:hypothetical protein [Massilia sp. YIM B04103]